MSPNPDNVKIWSDASVYSCTDVTPVFPANAGTALGAGWHHLGILDGKAGFPTDRKWKTNLSYGWGQGVVAESHSEGSFTRQFTCLEDNADTKAILWPGSTATSIVIPRPIKIWLCFEKVSDDGHVDRLFTTRKAGVWCDKFTDSEADITSYPFDVTLFANGADELYTAQSSPSLTSIALSPLTLALSLGGANIKTTVATATYSDATTADVSALAAWTSSAPTKATVSAGYVTGLTTGTSNITCTYLGVSSTAACVATVGA